MQNFMTIPDQTQTPGKPTLPNKAAPLEETVDVVEVQDLVVVEVVVEVLLQPHLLERIWSSQQLPVKTWL